MNEYLRIIESFFHNLGSIAVETSFSVPKIFSLIAVDLPKEAWWVPLPVVLILAGTALFDAFKGRVPDLPLLLGILFITAARGLYSGWDLAAFYLLAGFGFAFALWFANQLYYKAFSNDAIGMGDAKWTALAVSSFSSKPLIWAWVLGAWLGLSWLALKGICSVIAGAITKSGKSSKQYEYIHFAPFLFIGLLAGLYGNYINQLCISEIVKSLF